MFLLFVFFLALHIKCSRSTAPKSWQCSRLVSQIAIAKVPFSYRCGRRLISSISWLTCCHFALPFIFLFFFSWPGSFIFSIKLQPAILRTVGRSVLILWLSGLDDCKRERREKIRWRFPSFQRVEQRLLTERVSVMAPDNYADSQKGGGRRWECVCVGGGGVDGATLALLRKGFAIEDDSNGSKPFVFWHCASPATWQTRPSHIGGTSGGHTPPISPNLSSLIFCCDFNPLTHQSN